MKNILLFGSVSLALAVAPTVAHAQDEKPSGFISANTDLVHAAKVKPILTWKVNYPPFEPPNTTQDVIIKVRVLGVALQSGSGSEIAASARLRIGGKWHHIFSGKGSDVSPNKVLFEAKVPANTEIQLGAEGSSWGERSSVGKHVTVLQNGDKPPSYAPALSQGDVVSFLSGYMDGDTVSIGKNDAIYVAELYSTDTGAYWYDMQDIVVHVSFEPDDSE